MLQRDKSSCVESEITPLRPPRVLLVEDDDEMRRLLALRFRHHGYEVLEAKDGLAAAERLGTHLVDSDPPELIVADIRMPGCTGLQLLDAVRRTDWATPVILITAFGDAQTRTEAFRLGAAALFDKPFDVDDLCTMACAMVPPR